jgi:hypothetical protein
MLFSVLDSTELAAVNITVLCFVLCRAGCFQCYRSLFCALQSWLLSMSLFSVSCSAELETGPSCNDSGIRQNHDMLDDIARQGYHVLKGYL